MIAYPGLGQIESNTKPAELEGKGHERVRGGCASKIDRRLECKIISE